MLNNNHGYIDNGPTLIVLLILGAMVTEIISGGVITKTWMGWPLWLKVGSVFVAFFLFCLLTGLLFGFVFVVALVLLLWISSNIEIRKSPNPPSKPQTEIQHRVQDLGKESFFQMAFCPPQTPQPQNNYNTKPGLLNSNLNTSEFRYNIINISECYLSTQRQLSLQKTTGNLGGKWTFSGRLKK